MDYDDFLKYFAEVTINYVQSGWHHQSMPGELCSILYRDALRQRAGEFFEIGQSQGIALTIRSTTEVYITIHQLDQRLRVSNTSDDYADTGFEVFSTGPKPELLLGCKVI